MKFRSLLALLFLLKISLASQVLFINPSYAPSFDSPNKEKVSGTVEIVTNVSSSDWNNANVKCYYTPFGGAEIEIGDAVCDSSGTWRTCNCTWDTSNLSPGDYLITSRAYVWDPINGNQLDAENSTWVYLLPSIKIEILSPSYAPSESSPSKETVSDIFSIISNVTAEDWSSLNIACYYFNPSTSERNFIEEANCSGSGNSRICNCTFDMSLDSLQDGDYKVIVNTTYVENFTWVYADNPVYIVITQIGTNSEWENSRNITVRWDISGAIPDDFGNVSVDCESDGEFDYISLSSNDLSCFCEYSNDGIFNITLISSDNKGHSKKYLRQVKIDTVKPNSSINATPDLWFNHSLILRINASDDFSGIKGIYYSLVPSEENCSFLFSPSTFLDLEIDSSGKWKVCYFSVDNANNSESLKEVSPILVDLEPPVSLIQSQSLEDWSENAHVNLTFFENISGIEKAGYLVLNYSLSCPFSTSSYFSLSGNFSFNISQEGIWKVCTFAKDFAGNLVFNQSFPYKIDKNYPEISFSFENNTWLNKTEVNFSYSLWDISFLEGYFKIYNSSWLNVSKHGSGGIFSKDFNLSDGCYWIELNATDSLDRVSRSLYKICIDTTTPSLSYSIIENMTEGFYTESILHVNYSASDENFYSFKIFVNGNEINSSEEEQGILSFYVPQGNLTLCFEAWDRVNKNGSCFEVKVDYSGPVIKIMSPKKYEIRSRPAFNLIFESKDLNFDKTRCKIYLDGFLLREEEVEKEKEIEFETKYGKHDLKVCCYDFLNHSSCSSLEFSISPPPTSLFISKPEKIEKIGVVIARNYNLDLNFSPLCYGKEVIIKASNPARLFIYFWNRSIFRRYDTSNSFSVIFPEEGEYFIYAAGRGIYKGWIYVGRCEEKMQARKKFEERKKEVDKKVKEEERKVIHSEEKTPKIASEPPLTKNFVLIKIRTILNFVVKKILSLFLFLFGKAYI